MEAIKKGLLITLMVAVFVIITAGILGVDLL